jgi:hypothetical protein
VTKHAIKQVDRLFSNQNIDVWDSLARWVSHLIGARKEIVVAMDWTAFDCDGQATLALNTGDWAWPRYATAVGDGLERGTFRAAQRF